ncbi:hypothetical protein [Radiobacillus sp. PE A8.2]
MNTIKKTSVRMQPIKLAQVKLDGQFWSPWQKLVCDSIISNHACV